MTLSRRDLINGWIAITLALSIIAWLDGGLLARYASLAPARIWRGEVWRLVTWIFIELGPTSLVFTCAVIYKFAGELVPRWGTRRMLRFMLEVVLAASVASSLVALVSDDVHHMVRCGGLVVPDVLVIAWARQFPNETLSLYYGMLRLRGRDIVRLTVGVVILFALFVGPTHMIPELVGTLLAALYPQPRLARL